MIATLAIKAAVAPATMATLSERNPMACKSAHTGQPSAIMAIMKPGTT